MTETSHNAPVRPVVLVAAVLSLLAVVGCRTESEETVTTRDINVVLEKYDGDLMSIPEVVAVGVGQLSDGTPCIKIYVTRKTDEVMEKLPKNLEGYPVLVEVSGKIEPLESD